MNCDTLGRPVVLALGRELWATTRVKDHHGWTLVGGHHLLHLPREVGNPPRLRAVDRWVHDHVPVRTLAR